MKIKNFALIFASTIFATASFAANPSLTERTDNIYLNASPDTALRVVEVSSVDPDLTISVMNDHQMRVVRPHFKSGTFTTLVSLNEAGSCLFTIKSGCMNEAMEYQKCSNGWRIAMKRKGLSAYYLDFSQSYNK